jgi:hypothetical protein
VHRDRTAASPHVSCVVRSADQRAPRALPVYLATDRTRSARTISVMPPASAKNIRTGAARRGPGPGSGRAAATPGQRSRSRPAPRRRCRQRRARPAARPRPVGAVVVAAAQQQPPDPMQRIMLAAAVPGPFLLDPPHLGRPRRTPPSEVERVEHPHCVRQGGGPAGPRRSLVAGGHPRWAFRSPPRCRRRPPDWWSSGRRCGSTIRLSGRRSTTLRPQLSAGRLAGPWRRHAIRTSILFPEPGIWPQPPPGPTKRSPLRWKRPRIEPVAVLAVPQRPRCWNARRC